MRFSTRYLAVIGLVIFAYIVRKIGIKTILESIYSIKASYIPILFFVVGLNVMLKSFKWKTVIKAYNFDYPLKNACAVFLIAMFTGLITPGRIGDLIKAFYLKNNKFSLGKSLSTVIVDRLFDIATLVLLGLTSAIWLSLILGINSIYLPVILVASAFVFIMYIFAHKELTKKVLRPVFYILVPEKYKSSIKLNFEEFYGGMYNARKLGLAFAFFLGILSWFITAMEGYLIALSLNLSIPYYYFVFLIPIITLIELIPISISGLGTREAAVIFLFSLIGFAAEKAVAFSMLYLVLGYWASALLGAFLWFRNPIRVDISPKI